MMIGPAFTALLLIAVVVWLWKRRRPTPDQGDGGGTGGFRVSMRGGRVTGTRGVVPRSVYNAFEEIAALSEADGEITWDPDEGLTFSPTIPDGVEQQLRNVFEVSRIH